VDGLYAPQGEALQGRRALKNVECRGKSMRADVNSRAAILGIGRMATGLAVDLALNGCPVDVIDLKPRTADERRAKVADLKTEFAASADKLGRRTDDLPAPDYCGDQIPQQNYDCVFEALPEEIPVKQAAYNAMRETLGQATALCSMTSTFTVEELTANLDLPVDLVVTHFMNPPWLIPFLEVVTPEAMASDKVEALFSFLRDIGHMPIQCKSSPGFVISRLQVGLMNEAVRLMEEGVASPEDIDRAITHGWGYRFPVMGILEFIDAGGLDILHHGGRSVARALDRPDLNSPELIAQKYAEGALGTKTLKGLFDYGDGSALAEREAIRLDRQVRLKALLDQFQAEEDERAVT
jgi:3-hydroxybutyryl-CoA dehydrogenase